MAFTGFLKSFQTIGHEVHCPTQATGRIEWAFIIPLKPKNPALFGDLRMVGKTAVWSFG